MSIEDKRLARLADEFANIIGRFSPTDRTDQSMALAARALELGADLPPEPQWKPRQVVLLRLEDGMPYLAKRVDSNDGWEVFGVDVVITDDEVTDVEPVAVLTAEDARDLGEGRGIGSFERFFRERGVGPVSDYTYNEHRVDHHNGHNCPEDDWKVCIRDAGLEVIDELRAENERLRKVIHDAASEIGNLVSRYTVAHPENTLRVLNLLWADQHNIAQELREAL